MPTADQVPRPKRQATLSSGEQLRLSTHAIRRFDERGAGGVGDVAASERLRQLIAVIAVEEDPPSWLYHGPRTRAERYVTLGDDIALAIVGTTIVTVLARGYFSDETRERRNARKRARRQARRARAQRQKHVRPEPYRRDHQHSWASSYAG